MKDGVKRRLIEQECGEKIGFVQHKKMKSFSFRIGRKLQLLKEYVKYIKLCWLSFTYNSYGSKTDLVFEPIFTFVYYAVHWCGPIFVCLVVLLTSSVVFVYYHDVIPFILAMRSQIYQSLIIIYGHYLLTMIVFHFYMATTTDPGKVPSEVKGMVSTSVCKRCVSPKPPRTHHCSVCKRCRLKMDHHCPWLNNCVGHFNHRYFISFCTFMTMGTIFVTMTTFPLFYHCFHLRRKIYRMKKNVNDYIELFTLNKTGQQEVDLVEIYIRSNDVNRGFIIYLWILCFAVTIALGLLTFWHAYLISKGETSVEKLINQKERDRLLQLKLEFVNLYDYGVLANWKLLLGFHDFRTFIRRVMLPSTHHPYCNGINWKISPNPKSYHNHNQNTSFTA